MVVKKHHQPAPPSTKPAALRPACARLSEGRQMHLKQQRAQPHAAGEASPLGRHGHHDTRTKSAAGRPPPHRPHRFCASTPIACACVSRQHSHVPHHAYTAASRRRRNGPLERAPSHNRLAVRQPLPRCLSPPQPSPPNHRSSTWSHVVPHTVRPRTASAPPHE